MDKIDILYTLIAVAATTALCIAALKTLKIPITNQNVKLTLFLILAIIFVASSIIKEGYL